MRLKISILRDGRPNMCLPAPDLRLRVDERRVDGRVVLAYSLEDSSRSCDKNLEYFESQPFRRDPIDHFKALFRSVEQLSDPGNILERQKRLESFGVELFQTLLPPGLQRRLWSLPRSACTLLILSDEAWIPWELMKLRDPDSDAAAGPFFAEAFALTRWPSGDSQQDPAPLLQLQQLAFVLPKGSGPETAESDLVDALSSGDRETVEMPARYLDVLEALGQGRYDGWHFAGHGLSMGEHPNQWGLRLDQGKLTATDLAGEARRLGRSRPLIFLNSCNSARAGHGLMGIGGLADAFLGAGAGALIGTYWSIPDDRAKAFADAFYERFLKAELPMGEAIRQARERIRSQFPGDPTWLAYTVFSHPLSSHRPVRPAVLESTPKSPESLRGPKPVPMPQEPDFDQHQPIWRKSIAVAVIGALATIIAALINSPWMNDDPPSVSEPRQMSVRVAERDGAPVSGAKVVLYADGGPSQGTTDSNGAAELSIVKAGEEPARLVIQAEGFQIAERLVHPSRDRFVDVRLERPDPEKAAVLFRIIDGSHGTPIRNAEVQLFLGADPLLQTTDDKGLVKFPVDFQDGEADVQLSIQAPSHEIEYQRVTLRPNTVQDVLLNRRRTTDPPLLTESPQTHDVVLVLPSTMEGAEIQVDGHPAVVLKDLGLFVTIQVNAKSSNHHFELRKGERSCSQEIRIGPKTLRLQPCDS